MQACPHDPNPQNGRSLTWTGTALNFNVSFHPRHAYMYTYMYYCSKGIRTIFSSSFNASSYALHVSRFRIRQSSVRAWSRACNQKTQNDAKFSTSQGIQVSTQLEFATMVTGRSMNTEDRSKDQRVEQLNGYVAARPAIALRCSWTRPRLLHALLRRFDILVHRHTASDAKYQQHMKSLAATVAH
jgi:hypothetical protein